MAIDVKSSADSAAKWTQGASGRATEYKARAAAAAGRWATNTQGASGNFQAAVTSGNIGNRFAAGVARAGSQKYANGINTKGDRYSQGVASGAGNYTNGVGPYLQTLSGLNLSPRGPRGDPRNYTRVNEVGNALHAQRLAALSAGV